MGGTDRGAQPTRLEREFLGRLGSHHADAERRALAGAGSSRRHQNRTAARAAGGRRRLRVVFALAAAFLAVDRSRTAADERVAAQQARIFSRPCTSPSSVRRRSRCGRPSAPSVALLAAEAWRAKPDALSESALLGTFTEGAGVPRLHDRSPTGVIQGDTVPGHRTAVVASGTRMHVVDLTTGELGPAFDHTLSSDKPVYFSWSR